MSSIVEYQITDNIPQTVYYTRIDRDAANKYINHQIEHEQGLFCCSFIRKVLLVLFAALILLVIFKIIKKICKKKTVNEVYEFPLSASSNSDIIITPLTPSSNTVHRLSDLMSVTSPSLQVLPSMF